MEYYDEKNNLVLEYGQDVTLKKWPPLSGFFGESELVAFRYSEYQIVILANLKPNNDEFYNRFQINTNVINALTQNLYSIKELTNLSTCSLKNDLIIVDEPETLVNVYKDGNIRLIIICGHDLSEEERQVLMEIKRYDPYARFMLVKKYKEGQFLFDVELNYIRDNWK